MDERGIFSDLQSYHTGGGDNIPTSNDPFASEVTLDPELLGDLSNNTAEDLPSTGGSNYGRTAAQTHSNQDSYPRQAFPYTGKAAAPSYFPRLMKHQLRQSLHNFSIRKPSVATIWPPNSTIHHNFKTSNTPPFKLSMIITGPSVATHPTLRQIPSPIMATSH